MSVDVDKVANKIRDLYCSLRTERTGVPFTPGNEYNNLWERVARWCLGNGVPPEEYMEYQFAQAEGYPQIGVVVSAQSMTQYLALKKPGSVTLSADSQAVVQRTALRIRDTYSRLRSVYCVHAFTPSERFDETWVKAAKQCIAYGIDPYEFVEVQFHAIKPYPNIQELACPAAIRRFNENRSDRASDVTRNVSIEFAAFKKLRDLGRTPREILVDQNQGFDHLFKYIISKEYALDDLLQLFWDGAIERYLSSVYYDRIYQGKIPEELRKVAEGVRNHA